MLGVTFGKPCFQIRPCGDTGGHVGLCDSILCSWPDVFSYLIHLPLKFQMICDVLLVSMFVFLLFLLPPSLVLCILFDDKRLGRRFSTGC